MPGLKMSGALPLFSRHGVGNNSLYFCLQEGTLFSYFSVSSLFPFFICYFLFVLHFLPFPCGLCSKFSDN
jgi:hypothetical protein